MSGSRRPAERFTSAFSEGLRTCNKEASRSALALSRATAISLECCGPKLLPSHRDLQVQQYGLCLKATLPEVRRNALPLPLPAACRLHASGLPAAAAPEAHPLSAMQVEKGVCELEFQQLRACWLRAFRASLRASK